MFCIFIFGYFSRCKKQDKNIALKTKVIKFDKDTIPNYPKYLNKNYVLGKFNYTIRDDFVIVPKYLSNKKIYVRKEVLDAFIKMEAKARKENVLLKIISGTRNFNHQKRIWNYKWNEKYKNLTPLKRAEKILEFSAMPSTSRHHWGTDIDLNSLSNTYFSFRKGKKEYNWLIKNASKFGFYQPYTSKKNGRTGYNEEKWHWSYAPLSTLYLDYYNKNISINDIDNFDGFELASDLNIISDFVNGVNPELLK
ncbi:M15 family metallopeptidase [uncultured Polaribacter sp.]|uniref:M15 family metallopeptidase n=1 Tax=uncultured Polaribacter sp. TaxID=174711 RepID=UPI002606A461|nr:M15 family metallopeptidase [uncultured Polaribacter sp.]